MGLPPMTPGINQFTPNISLMANHIIGNIMGHNPMMSGTGIIQNPLMNPGMFQAQVMSMQPKIDSALKKIFVKNIPEDFPDTFMESILNVSLKAFFILEYLTSLR